MYYERYEDVDEIKTRLYFLTTIWKPIIVISNMICIIDNKLMK